MAAEGGLFSALSRHLESGVDLGNEVGWLTCSYLSKAGVLSIVPKIPEISVGIQLDSLVSVSSDCT